jgi:hypothetical protein
VYRPRNGSGEGERVRSLNERECKLADYGRELTEIEKLTWAIAARALIEREQKLQQRRRERVK